MALHVKALRTRTITALFFGLVMLAGLFINQWTFILLFGIILCGCLYEFYKISKLIWPLKYFYYLPLSLVYIVLPVLLMVYLGITIIITTAGNKPPEILYSPIIPCAIIFSIWVNDTMAYIVGSMIGKTPFSKISPNKTWEGTIGGALLCIIVIGLLSRVLPQTKQSPITDWINIAAICAFFGTLGDLLESKLKRMADIKDSGNFMPGHGGFLDRFDSLLVATPFVWLYVYLFL